MLSVAPGAETQNQQSQNFKEWAGGFVLALLRLCGSLALVATLFLLSAPYVAPLYDSIGLLGSIIIVSATHVLTALYFTRYYRGKTVLPAAFGSLLTGLIYFCGGVVVTVIGLNMTIAPYLFDSGKGVFSLLNLFYLLGGLAVVLIVMKGKRRF